MRRKVALLLFAFIAAGCGSAFGQVDLAIEDIYADRDCQLCIRYANVGTVMIQNSLQERVIVRDTNHNLLKEFVNPKTAFSMAPGTRFVHVVCSMEEFQDRMAALRGNKITSPMALKVWADVDCIFDDTGYALTPGRLNESNKTNNKMMKTVTCSVKGKLPDLVQWGLFKEDNLQTYTDPQGNVFERYAYHFFVNNEGHSDVAQPFQVLVEENSGPGLSFVQAASVTVPSLAAGTRTCITQTCDTGRWARGNPNLPKVKPRIRITIDSGHVIDEILEDNNVHEGSL